VILIDANLLVYAHREDAPNHGAYRDWLASIIEGDSAYGLADLVLSRFIRVVAHPRVFTPPTPLQPALTFATQLRDQPNCVLVSPGPRHWDIFSRLCEQSEARGNLVPDAYLAALAIESGSEWITTDRDYSRFSGLRWRHPLAGR
jgi:uncharacterized protein